MGPPPPDKRPIFHVARHKASETVDRDLEPPVPPEVRRSAMCLQLVTAGVALVAVAATFFLGGFDRVAANREAEPKLPSVPVRQAFDAGPWRLTVTNAAFVDELGTLTPGADGNHLLAVAVTVEITDNETRFMNEAVSLSGVDGLVDEEPESIKLIRDSTLAFKLHPGLPERVAFVWEVKAGTRAPSQVVVVLNGATKRLTNFRFLNNEVEDRGPRATVTVPVEDRTGTT